MSVNEEVASIILAGGTGSRLFPLTINNCKPNILFGGRHRLIDIPISTSLNSNIKKIFILGQYLHNEINDHISKIYSSNLIINKNLSLLTPSKNKKNIFKGTADAIRKNLNKILESSADYFLILSGDQIYNINFIPLLEFAKKKNADLTIASILIPKSKAKRLGILKINDDNLIKDFYEKPTTEAVLSNFSKNNKYIASMGIYVFKRDVLEKLLLTNDGDDFGKHLIPKQIKTKNSYAFIYDCYWEDIGTIKSYYDANLFFINSNLNNHLYDINNPIYTASNYLSGSKIINTTINNSIICEGSHIQAKIISNSIIGIGCKINKNTIIKNSIILGTHSLKKNKLPENLIGENCILNKTIIDENVHISDNVCLINKKKYKNYRKNNVFIKDGIIIIPSNSYIPKNFSI